MSRKPIWLGALAVALVALGPLAGSAVAKGDKFSDASMEATLRGSNGYDISIEGSGGQVDINALSNDGFADYRVDGVATRNRLKANFGSLGVVSLRFVGDGAPKRKTSGKGCDREVEFREEGTFKGKIRFHGEHGFTTAKATHAHGSYLRETDYFCDRGQDRGVLDARPTRGFAGKGGAQETLLTVGGPSAALRFVADGSGFEPEDTGISFVDARSDERRGRITIEREGIFDNIPPSSLTLEASDGAVTGTMKPPAPFHGAAEFTAKEAGESVAITGDLSVALPGAPRVPLADHGLKALFCEGSVRSESYKQCFNASFDLFDESLLKGL